jgi:negative regulator of sigma E activity
MSEHLGERLSAYLDGELDGEALAAATAHLAVCAECRAALEGLQQLARRAEALEDRPPERDLWPGVAARLAGATLPGVIPLRRRRFAFSIPQLAAASLAVVALSAGAAVLLTRRSAAPAFPVAAAPGLPATPGFLASAKGIKSYDAAIRDLEATLAARRSTLDTATIGAVEQSLAVIDRAIRQAEAALAQDPNNMYLNNHLAHALDRKLDLLRRVTSMAAAS